MGQTKNFKCNKCGHEWEITTGVGMIPAEGQTETPAVEEETEQVPQCPECGSSEVEMTGGIFWD